MVTIFQRLSASCAFAILATFTVAAPAKIPVILDTDIGTDIDDAFALALALASPELDLRGVTTVSDDAYTRALIACRFLDAAGRGDVPVAAGRPRRETPAFLGQYQYGLRAARKQPERELAVEFLHRQLQARPGQITIITVGDLTNIGELITRHPEAKPWIKRVVIMGGSVRVGYRGQPPPEREWNIRSDVKSAQILFRSGIPLVVAPLDATLVRFTEPFRERLLATPNAMCQQLWSLYELWDKATPTLFDPVAVTLAFNESLVRMEWLRIEVDDQGFTREVPGEPNCRVAMSIRSEPFLDWYVQRIIGWRSDTEQAKARAPTTAEGDRPGLLAKPVPQGPMPHRVHVAEDYETDIERRWWLAGKLSTNDVPLGSTRACRAVPCNDFDDQLGNPAVLYKAVIFNPVPGPPMGRNPRLSFRYRLDGTDALRIQVYSLSRGYHRRLTLTDVASDRWSEATAQFAIPAATAWQPPGIDEVRFLVSPGMELWVDDVLIFEPLMAASTGAPDKTLPPVAELSSRAELPDPLVMFDGRRVTTREQWFNERRPELVALFQHYMYGVLPPRPERVSGKLEREDRGMLGGKATLKEVTITFGPPKLRPIHLMLVVPNRREVPAPVVLSMNYFGNHTLLRDPAIALSTNWMPERGTGVVNNLSTEASRGTWADIWRIEYVIDRGYALATFYNGDIDPDRPDARGIQTYFKHLDPALDCATIAAWAWGLSRAVDYLVTDKDVDRQRIVVTGHSRLGKAALLAAALDERIALAIPHQAGSGGSAPSRTHVKPAVSSRRDNAPYPLKAPETVTQLNDKFPHWFNARFKEFNGKPERLPFDQHCLVALCAPRPVLFTNGRDDTWINPDGQFEVLRAAAPVYRLLGAGDFAATQPPPDGQLIDSTLGFFLRPGGHSLRPEDWKAFLDFADKHLGPSGKPHAASAPAPRPVAAGEPTKPEAALVEVPCWDLHEFELHGRCQVENPFRDAALVGEFTAPSGKIIRVEGFYDGDDAWRLRFAPNEQGEWRYHLRGEGVDLSQRGRLKCIGPRGHGFIRVHPENPYAFAHADGTAFFPMGDTCYGLYDDSPITPALRHEYLDTRREQRFNFVRMSIGHSEARAARDPAYWAWGGTPNAPDLDRLNPVFFRGLDALFRDLRTRGMNVELLLLNFYRRPFTDTRLWTPARERLWLRHVMARYAAFDNLFLWTLANEYETHPDGHYRLDRPGDLAWAKATARLVKQLDPYRHLVTVHPVISASTRGASPGDPFDPPWRIGPFFGQEKAFDVLSQQTSAAYAGVWDEMRGCWTGDVPGVNRSITADRIYGKPVLNTEHGYEYLPGQPTERKQVHDTDKVRRAAWRIVCAGGYFAAGFNGTIGHNDVWNRIDAPNRYTFTVRDAGAAAQLSALHQFFTALPFWRMQPFEGMITGAEAVALAEPGSVYVLYLPHGGKVSVDLGAAKTPMIAQWFNPRDGSAGDSFTVAARRTETFQAPDAADWVLRLHQGSDKP